MHLTNRNVILPLSVTFLCVAQLLHRLSGGSKWMNFFEGLFLGMAFALAAFSIVVGALAGSHE
jgi:hypothetical protein